MFSVSSKIYLLSLPSPCGLLLKLLDVFAMAEPVDELELQMKIIHVGLDLRLR